MWSCVKILQNCILSQTIPSYFLKNFRIKQVVKGDEVILSHGLVKKIPTTVFTN